jgi:hypothetical protein
MAIPGLLRALDAQQPSWAARVRWDEQRYPIRPELVLSDAITRRALAEAVASGCEKLGVAYDFSTPGREWEFPRVTGNEARAELLSTIAQGPKVRARADLLASLVSDRAVTESGLLIPTRLCVLRGQGHQFFLERLSLNARATAPSIVNGKKVIREPVAAISRALFQRWERADTTPSLRWDSGWIQRQWFRRYSNPGKDRVPTEAGAYILAAHGLPLLTASPVTIWRRIRLSIICVQVRSQSVYVIWPIWTKALSLQSLRTLLSHPVIYQDPPDRSMWSQLGIREVRSSEFVSTGKYTDFKRAVAI